MHHHLKHNINWHQRKFICFLLLFNTLSLASQGLKPTKILQPESRVLDEYYDFAPSSTLEIAGIMSGNSSGKINPQFFYSYIPKNSKSYLCVNITSKDGRYKGIWTYDIKNLKNGWVQLELPSKYQQKLKDYDTGDIGIVAKLSNKCLEDNSYVHTTSTWTPQASDSLVIYINSTENVNIVGIDAKGKIVIKKNFKEIKGGLNSKSYNRVCIIPLNYLNKYDFKLQYREIIDGYRKRTKYKSLPLWKSNE